MTSVPQALLDLPVVGLEELNSAASLQMRVDRKYVVPLTGLGAVLEGLPPGTRALQIAGELDPGYSSVYLDTPDLACFHAAGRRRRRRAKVRVRSYASTGAQFLEVKTIDGRGTTHKHRRPHNGALPLSPDARCFVDDLLSGLHLPALARALSPVLTTSYRRCTVLLPAVEGEAPARATVDLGLLCQASGTGSVLDLGTVAVVETKAGLRATALDRALWRAGHRPARMSKFGLGMALTHPDLTAEKWHRTLRLLT